MATTPDSYGRGEAPGWLCPELTEADRAHQLRARRFIDEWVYPRAHEFDAAEAIPSSVLQAAAAAGLWGAAVSAPHGGLGCGSVALGLISEELGRGSASLLSLFTVHSMVAGVIERWGKPAQKEQWLPRLARGEVLAAMALTEPQSGSDAGNLQTRIEKTATGFQITGQKRWISGGQIAGLILVVGALADRPTALLVEPERTDGLKRTPMRELAAFRAAQAAELDFQGCEIPAENLVGRVGFGLSLAAGYGLDLGRLCVAYGAVGVCEDCLRLCAHYAQQRCTFGHRLEELALIQRLMAHMTADTVSARLVCHQAALVRDAQGAAIDETNLAKFYASAAAQRVTDNALHLYAAPGLTATSPIQRHWRDARIFQIIEGTTQLQETFIGKHALRLYRA